MKKLALFVAVLFVAGIAAQGVALAEGTCKMNFTPKKKHVQAQAPVETTAPAPVA